MSFTVTQTANSSVLSNDFNPSIELGENEKFEVGLINFETFNTIPNVNDSNNSFVYERGSARIVIKLPIGAYEMDAIVSFIENEIHDYQANSTQVTDDQVYIKIEGNQNTSKVSITTNTIIDFTDHDSIGSLLGFHKRILSANKKHYSDEISKILNVNSICIDCNIAAGSFSNGKPVHIIHQFFPQVEAGYKIVESPVNILYFPVCVSVITNITLRVLDQDGELINFQNEKITSRLHIRRAT